MSEKAEKIQENNQEQVQAVQASELTSQEVLIAEYKATIDELNDKMLRAVAEAQNTRRRADIDVQNAKSFGIQSFAKDLLSVMDNLFRASDTISEEETDPKLKSIKEGIEITKREMLNVFERNGVKRIEPVGELFDPNAHQAISQVPDANAAPNTVLQVLQPGYILKDRVIRPALVVVSKPVDA